MSLLAEVMEVRGLPLPDLSHELVAREEEWNGHPYMVEACEACGARRVMDLAMPCAGVTA